MIELNTPGQIESQLLMRETTPGQVLYVQGLRPVLGAHGPSDHLYC